MNYGKVAVFTRPGEPVKIVEEEVRMPALDEILVRVSMVGVCGSDVHRLKGDIPVNAEAVCFGHEAIGVIESLCAEIKTDRAGVPLSEGDMLYWMPLPPCGVCSECGASKNPLHCPNLNWPPPFGKPNGACFRQYATLNKRCVFIRVPPSVPPEDIIVFGCGMPTALTGLKQFGAIRPGSDAVIQGSGPVGLACTLLASLAGARSVIVIGDPKRRLEATSALGATFTMSVADTTAEERLKLVKRLTAGCGASFVIEAAGTAAAFPEGFNLLGMNGKYLIWGCIQVAPQHQLTPSNSKCSETEDYGVNRVGHDNRHFVTCFDPVANQGIVRFPCALLQGPPADFFNAWHPFPDKLNRDLPVVAIGEDKLGEVEGGRREEFG
ncbi:hypothetical protein N7494_000213 [Penicillium frequentans]|uniref:Uncharacterized protein n=1 Tax=Penicillium frequentans TaxID=3151616 RepID=A0AAD6D5D2_9EURO|nr:hypothetical protein N7494_000213 [Penicillium glabrum]